MPDRKWKYDKKKVIKKGSPFPERVQYANLKEEES
jgi:hypothetical protein